MDPDIPHPSIEGAEPPHQSLSPVVTQVTNSAESTPRPPSTPLKSASRSPSRTQSPRIASRSPSVASVRHERTVSPALRTRQSLSNLSPSRSATPLKTQFRRASSNLNPASPSITPKSGAMPPGTPQHKVLTPSMVATDYFAKELEDHATTPSKVVVITHDACYGHRYSRPRTSKVGLSMIVERPERILATVLGASTAYVRLGGRHAGSKYPPHPDKQAPSHTRPFQIRKTARSVPLTHACVTAVHGNKWMEELQIMCDTAESKLAMNGKELVRPVGYGKMKQAIRCLNSMKEISTCVQSPLQHCRDVLEVFATPSTPSLPIKRHNVRLSVSVPPVTIVRPTTPLAFAGLITCMSGLAMLP